MLQFNPNKAGMANIDREKVSKVIAENTSATYSAFSAKQQARVDARIAEIRQKLASATPAEWARAEKEMDAFAAKLEAHRDLSRHCVHIDMDAYFAAVEMRDDPRLRDVPMAVGSAAMLGTSNYLARRYGVRAAMPGFIAKKLCPELEIVPGDYKKYSHESKIFSEVFAEYDPDMGMGSLDEAYIDLTEFMNQRTCPKTFVRKRYGGECICRLPLINILQITEDLSKSSESCKKCGKTRIVYEDEVEFGVSRGDVVNEIRFRVEQLTGLTCSAGIAANFMLAKICSDFNKPNGQFELENDYGKIMKFLQDLPIRKVCGIGRVSEAHLQACDINTVGELLERKAALKFVFSALSQESFLRIALGLPGRPREGDPRRKSVSVERTFTPTTNPAELKATVKYICEELAADVAKMELLGGKCVTLKIKLSNFDVLTRSVTLPNTVKIFEELYSAASDILNRELGQEMRLLGVRLSQLKFPFDEQDEKPKKTVLDFFNAKKAKIEESTPCCSETEPSTAVDSDVEILTSDESNDGVAQINQVECPICGKKLENDDRMVNAHIDECLNSDILVCEERINKKPVKRKADSTIKSYFLPKI